LVSVSTEQRGGQDYGPDRRSNPGAHRQIRRQAFERAADLRIGAAVWDCGMDTSGTVEVAVSPGMAA